MLNRQISILNLSNSTIEANHLSISQAAGASSGITTFNARYAGYLEINGTSTTTNGFITVGVDPSTCSICGGPSNYQFRSGTSLYVLVLPASIGVSFGNSETSGTVTATITVVYVF